MALKFGLTLPNRGVIFGVETIDELIEMGVEAEQSGLFESLWIGDSILAKRRPESVALLGALGARTRKVRLAVGCMASFPIRNPLLLAAQWSTLDLIAGPNRLILAACLGGEGGGGDWQMEAEGFNVPQGERVGRLEEGIEILKAVWTNNPASYRGKYYQFTDVVSEPRPLTSPHPAIWIASNPRPTPNAPGASNANRATRRIARLADGWMTTWLTASDFAQRWESISAALTEAGRDPDTFDNTLYYNVHINEDREAAYDETKRFLDTYYSTDHSRARLDIWVAYGSPAEVIQKLREFEAAGAKEITVRLTSWDQRHQYRRFVEEVLPAFQTATVS